MFDKILKCNFKLAYEQDYKWIRFVSAADLDEYENAAELARPEEERTTEAEKNATLQKQLEVRLGLLQT
jgi:hypothetical protein